MAVFTAPVDPPAGPQRGRYSVCGLDTVEANLHLGFDDDLRNYDISAEMLKILGVKSITLMTNNPSKVDGLRAAGVAIDERRPIKTTPNPHNFKYLDTKRKKSGHLL